MEYNELTAEEKRIILDKGTERPGTGVYDNHYEQGTYLCRQCNTPLYNSDSKFKSGCGWPSFDDEIEGAVKRVADADGRRVEIICNACEGHLGHVFVGERFTEKNTRHCVNSRSLSFVPASETPASPSTTKAGSPAILAGGCFWGMEELIRAQPGVLDTEVGYTGGDNKNPTYRNHPGHAEAIKIIFDESVTSFKEMLDFFFRIHNPTTLNRQGNDIGTSYRSTIFYQNAGQLKEAEEMIEIVNKSGRWGAPVMTTLEAYDEFWNAEDYHQDYLQKTPNGYTCHAIRFGSFLDDTVKA